MRRAGRADDAREWVARAFTHAEDVVYVGVGFLLAASAVALLITAAVGFVQSVLSGVLGARVIECEPTLAAREAAAARVQQEVHAEIEAAADPMNIDSIAGFIDAIGRYFGYETQDKGEGNPGIVKAIFADQTGDTGTVPLEPGSYHIVVSHGPEYDVYDQAVTITVVQTVTRMAHRTQPVACSPSRGMLTRSRMSGMETDWRIILALPLQFNENDPPWPSITARIDVTRRS